MHLTAHVVRALRTVSNGFINSQVQMGPQVLKQQVKPLHLLKLRIVYPCRKVEEQVLHQLQLQFVIKVHVT